METRKEKKLAAINRIKRKIRLQLYGWMFFILCALLFIAESAGTNEPLFLLGSLLFLVGCLFFIIPLIETLRRH